MESSLGYACLFFFIVCPLFTETIRCYKCDASDECRTIRNDSPLRYVDEEMENLEIIDCEHFCWKAVSLGKIFSRQMNSMDFLREVSFQVTFIEVVLENDVLYPIAWEHFRVPSVVKLIIVIEAIVKTFQS